MPTTNKNEEEKMYMKKKKKNEKKNLNPPPQNPEPRTRNKSRFLKQTNFVSILTLLKNWTQVWFHYF
jgi:hypothetical protein